MGCSVAAASEWKWTSIVAAAEQKAGLQNGKTRDLLEIRRKMVG